MAVDMNEFLHSSGIFIGVVFQSQEYTTVVSFTSSHSTITRIWSWKPWARMIFAVTMILAYSIWHFKKREGRERREMLFFGFIDAGVITQLDHLSPSISDVISDVVGEFRLGMSKYILPKGCCWLLICPGSWTLFRKFHRWVPRVNRFIRYQMWRIAERKAF